jgi:hypothetical protein
MKVPSFKEPKCPALRVAGLGGLFTVVNAAIAHTWTQTSMTVQSCKALAALVNGTLTLSHCTLPESFFVRIPDSRRLSVNKP